MEIIVPGKEYKLNGNQTVKFVGASGGSNAADNEEVLAMLLDRVTVLFAKSSAPELSNALIKLQEALFWIKKRNADVIARRTR